MDNVVSTFCIAFMIGLLIGTCAYGIYIRCQYNLESKYQPPLPVIVEETMESVKSKKYSCPQCHNPLEVKLYPTVYHPKNDWTPEPNIYFQYKGDYTIHNKCPKCNCNIYWEGLEPTMWLMPYRYCVEGEDNYNKICNTRSIYKDTIDWEEWLRNENLL